MLGAESVRFLLPRTRQHILHLDSRFSAALAAGDFVLARRLGIRLCLLVPGVPDTHAAVALCCLRSGLAEQALAHAQRCLRLAPAHALAGSVLQEALGLLA